MLEEFEVSLEGVERHEPDARPAGIMASPGQLILSIRRIPEILEKRVIRSGTMECRPEIAGRI
jgi:hypothetical protein